MKRIINTLEKMPKWYGFLTILLYSLLLAEFLITTNHLVNNNNLETDRLFVILARMSYIIIVLSAIVIWLISTFLFHLTAILFNGYAPFKHLLYISSYFYIIPAISVFISIFLLNQKTEYSTSNAVTTLQNNYSLGLPIMLVNYSFIPYYLLCMILIHPLYKVRLRYAIASVVIPILSVWAITKLFTLL